MKRISFSWKMWLLPTVSLAVFAAGLLVTWLNTQHSREAIDHLGRVDYQYFVKLQLATGELNGVQETLKNAIAAADKGAVEEVAKRGKKLQALVTEIGTLPEKREIATQIGGLTQDYLSSAIESASIMLQVKEGDLAAAVGKMQPALKALNDLLESENAQAASNNEKGLATADQRLQSGLWLNLGIALVIATVLVGGSFLIIRSVGRELGGDPEYAKGVIHAVAAGDLTRDIRVRVGDDSSLLSETRAMQQRLARAIRAIRTTAQGVNDASREIALGNGDLSQRTDAQASNLEQTVQQLSDLLAKTKENADHAQRAAVMAEQASNAAARGGAAVDEVVQTMESINEAARRITEFVGLIDGIAFQTNILALNAAVEAARAGEQGRGFAVVASEVRMLAQRSAEAAKQVSTVVGDSVSRVDVGTRQVQGAGALMQEIVSNTSEARGIVAQITESSREQDAAIQMLSQAIESLNRDTTQNAALVNESATSTQSLEARANELMQSIEAFRIREHA